MHMKLKGINKLLCIKALKRKVYTKLSTKFCCNVSCSQLPIFHHPVTFTIPFIFTSVTFYIITLCCTTTTFYYIIAAFSTDIADLSTSDSLFISISVSTLPSFLFSQNSKSLSVLITLPFLALFALVTFPSETATFPLFSCCTSTCNFSRV